MWPDTSLKIPLAHYDFIEGMPLGALSLLCNVLLSSAKVIRSKHPSAFNDTDRSQLVHDRFISKCFAGLQAGMIPFEYIHVSVREYNEPLRKHFDVLNDWRDNYNHSAVYSYFITYEGTLYRVTIVMCSRRSMGSLMENIRK